MASSISSPSLSRRRWRRRFLSLRGAVSFGFLLSIQWIEASIQCLPRRTGAAAVTRKKRKALKNRSPPSISAHRPSFFVYLPLSLSTPHQALFASLLILLGALLLSPRISMAQEGEKAAAEGTGAAVDGVAASDAAAAAAAASPASSSSSSSSPPPPRPPTPSPSRLAASQYRRAQLLRRKIDYSPRDARLARFLLASAAGVEVSSRREGAGTAAADPLSGSWPGLWPPSSSSASASADSSTSSSSSLSSSSEISTKIKHAAAAAELSAMLDAGEGGPRDPGAALALAARAAAAGDPAAQRVVGLALATGARPTPLSPSSSSSSKPLTRVKLVRPDWPRALPYLYFAAAGNDSLAQLALGFRHATGAGVPRSCAAAVLYYNPVAEAVIAAARSPVGLPALDRTRLAGPLIGSGGIGIGGGGGGAAGSRKGPTRDQEVLHYQWFADMGHAGAARAVGQLLAAEARAARGVAGGLGLGAARGAGLGGVVGGPGFGGGGGGTVTSRALVRDFVDGDLLADDEEDEFEFEFEFEGQKGQGPASKKKKGAVRAPPPASPSSSSIPPAAKAALRYLRRAADAGDADAMASLGHLHASGAGGVPRSDAAALAWFRRGADRGSPSALYGLGYMRLAGVRDGSSSSSSSSAAAATAGGKGGGETTASARDPAKAAEAFRAAADAGSLEAHFHLGVMHLHGWGGLQPSDAQARAHFALAARGGHVLAAYNLAMMLLASPAAGECPRALELLRRVAERHPAVADALARGADAATGSDGWTRTGVNLGGGGGGKNNGNNGNAAARSPPSVDEGWALSSYLVAAEAGVEVAQSNAAWLLSRAARRGFGWRQQARRREAAARAKAEFAAKVGAPVSSSSSSPASSSSSSLPAPRVAAYPPTAAARLASRLYARAAAAGSTDALLKLGDAAWYGKEGRSGGGGGGGSSLFSSSASSSASSSSSSPNVSGRDWPAAARLYSAAARGGSSGGIAGGAAAGGMGIVVGQGLFGSAGAGGRSATALFNLGFAHEFGAGVPADLHLAKRYYDAAAAASADAAVPIAMARWWLRWHHWCDELKGRVGSVEEEKEEVGEGAGGASPASAVGSSAGDTSSPPLPGKTESKASSSSSSFPPSFLTPLVLRACDAAFTLRQPAEEPSSPAREEEEEEEETRSFEAHFASSASSFASPSSSSSSSSSSESVGEFLASSSSLEPGSTFSRVLARLDALLDAGGAAASAAASRSGGNGGEGAGGENEGGGSPSSDSSSSGQGKFGSSSSNVEGAVLAGLFGLLWLVLQRRRTVRDRAREAREAREASAAAEAAAAMAAATEAEAAAAAAAARARAEAETAAAAPAAPAAVAPPPLPATASPADVAPVAAGAPEERAPEEQGQQEEAAAAS